MEINDIGTQLLYTTVPIYAQNDDKTLSTGTGFLFSIRESETESIPLLITNYHVLKDAVVGFVELHIGEKGFPTDRTIRVQFDKSIINGNKLGDLDLIAVPLAGTFNDFQNRNIETFFRTVDQNMIPSKEQVDNLSAIEDITFIGYPSGLYDEKNKIGVDIVRALYGVQTAERANKSIIVTSSYFSEDAQKFANQQNTLIDLFNIDDLIKLMENSVQNEQGII